METGSAARGLTAAPIVQLYSQITLKYMTVIPS